MKIILTFFLSVFIFSFSFSQGLSDKCFDWKELTSVDLSDEYRKHLNASQSFGIKVLEDDNRLKKYIKNGKLKKVASSGKGYKIQKLSYSSTNLTPKAITTLQNIAQKFNKDNKGSTITITSVTRTLEQQCKLRNVNSNAAIGLSSHNYGNSFDISYVRFNNIHKSNPRLEKALEKVLKHYKDAGKIYYIKEKEQSCFHVSVRNY